MLIPLCDLDHTSLNQSRGRRNNVETQHTIDTAAGLDAGSAGSLMFGTCDHEGRIADRSRAS
jgi:hypothetical protein